MSRGPFGPLGSAVVANLRGDVILRFQRRTLSAVQLPPMFTPIFFCPNMSLPLASVPGAWLSPRATLLRNALITSRPPRRFMCSLAHVIASITSGVSSCAFFPSSEISLAPLACGSTYCHPVHVLGMPPTNSNVSAPVFLVSLIISSSSCVQLVGRLRVLIPFSSIMLIDIQLKTISGCCIIAQTLPDQVIVSSAEEKICFVSHLSRLMRSSSGAAKPLAAHTGTQSW